MKLQIHHLLALLALLIALDNFFQHPTYGNGLRAFLLFAKGGFA